LTVAKSTESQMSSVSSHQVFLPGQLGSHVPHWIITQRIFRKIIVVITIRQYSYNVVNHLTNIIAMLQQIDESNQLSNSIGGKEFSEKHISYLKRELSEAQTDLLKMDSRNNKGELTNQILRLMSLFESNSKLSIFQTSQATSLIQLVVRLLRRVVADENIKLGQIVKLSSLNYSLQENLYFYWRWICEEPPLHIEPKVEELIRDENAEPKFWVLLDVTRSDQPVLVSKQDNPHLSNSDLRKIFARFINENSYILDSSFEKREIHLGSFVVVQTSWSVDQIKSIWPKNLIHTKNSKHFIFYAVYSSQ